MTEPLFWEANLVQREIDAEMLLARPIPSPRARQNGGYGSFEGRHTDQTHARRRSNHVK